MKRQLAAILYADVAGYSRLTGQNEEQTHLQLDQGLTLLEEAISSFDGIKVHEAGDAILAEFSSVTAAVNAAVEAQKTMSTNEAELDENELVRFRIGVHLGEVIHDRGDIYGDGVNIAARIQEIANPGGLCVSSAVVEQLATSHDYHFEDLGYRDFKNIERPVHVYRLRFSKLLDTHPIHEIESRVQGQPLFDDAVDALPITKGQCACGSVRFEISQPSLGSGYCHCRICQRTFGAPVFAWTAFPRDAVKFTRKIPKYFKLSLIGEQGFCKMCGTSVVWRSLKPEPGNYLAIPTTCLDNPEDYAPTWHGGVESQLPWFEIHDDLPRVRSEEAPTLIKSWGSAGVPDPNDWKALAYEEAVSLDDDPD